MINAQIQPFEAYLKSNNIFYKKHEWSTGQLRYKLKNVEEGKCPSITWVLLEALHLYYSDNSQAQFEKKAAH